MRVGTLRGLLVHPPFIESTGRFSSTNAILTQPARFGKRLALYSAVVPVTTLASCFGAVGEPVYNRAAIGRSSGRLCNMPMYLYQCDSCGVRFERLQRMSDDPLTECPECDGHIHRVIQPVGVIFKGSGFYITDNRKGSSPTLTPPKDSDKSKEKKKADAGETKKESSASKDSVPAKDSSPKEKKD